MLATSMHAQPGVYALLLGSGVSTGAGVPTGWGVVKELVRRIAAVEDPDSMSQAEADPEQWWREHHDGELGYAALLEALAPTPAARQGLLADFFEASDEEREQGIKTPSKAHLAIAELVKRGTVKVIITTNFDRLMEQALDSVGVAAQVIARPETVAGMKPLVHAPATVIKLHGDYLDLGSRNTPSELEHYPEEWKTIIARVLDEYGLVISGWSADWDTGHSKSSLPAVLGQPQQQGGQRSKTAVSSLRKLDCRCGRRRAIHQPRFQHRQPPWPGRATTDHSDGGCSVEAVLA
jgi:NAD-dependent SIR2 family protein deacetylase